MKPNTIQFPTPGPPPERPRLPRRPDTDRLRFTYPSVPSLSYWTVDAVKSALAQHDWGMFWYSGLLEDQVERNPRIAAALNTRTLGVLGLPFSIDPGKGRSRKKAVKDLKEQWPAIAPQEVLAEMLRNLVMLGVAVAEVVWTTESGQWIPTLHPVHPVFVRWDRSIERLTVLAWGDLVPVTPGDGRWVVLTRARRWGWRGGVRRWNGSCPSPARPRGSPWDGGVRPRVGRSGAASGRRPPRRTRRASWPGGRASCLSRRAPPSPRCRGRSPRASRRGSGT
jgi:hypothetical protein